MFEDQHTPPVRPVAPTPQRRVRSLAAACLAGAAFVLLSGAAPAATAAPAASTATPIWTTGPPPGGVPGVAVPTIRWSDAGDGYQQAYASVPYDTMTRRRSLDVRQTAGPMLSSDCRAADPLELTTLDGGAARVGFEVTRTVVEVLTPPAVSRFLFPTPGAASSKKPGQPAMRHTHRPERNTMTNAERARTAPRFSPPMTSRSRFTYIRSPWILLVSAASLMFAAYYAVIAAVLVIHDEPTTLGGGPPAGVAAYLVVIGQFSFPGQLILLFAVIVLAGSMMLSAPVPPTADRTASYPPWPGWTSRLHRAQLLLAAVAGLLAVAYLVSGVLGLLVGRSVTGDQGPPPLILSSASVAALAFGVPTLGVLAALMPWRTGRTPSAMGSGDDSDSVVSDPALEISVVDAPSTPGASGDVIEGGPALRSTRQ
jgi:hypothetical protein